MTNVATSTQTSTATTPAAGRDLAQNTVRQGFIEALIIGLDSDQYSESRALRAGIIASGILAKAEDLRHLDVTNRKIENRDAPTLEALGKMISPQCNAHFQIGTLVSQLAVIDPAHLKVENLLSWVNGLVERGMGVETFRFPTCTRDAFAHLQKQLPQQPYNEAAVKALTKS